MRASMCLVGFALLFAFGSTPTLGVTATDPNPRFTIQQIGLEIRDAVYSPLTQRVYVSVPSSSAIVAVDPANGTIGQTLVVGANPSKLALSDDGRFLYVGLNGEHAVRRVDLINGTADPTFPLSSDPDYGSYVADDMAVVPGQPNSVVIALANETISPRHEGVALFVNSQRRPNTTTGHTGPNIIEFCSASDKLYGYNNESSEFGLYELTVAADGIYRNRLGRNLGVGFDMDFRCVDDLLYPTTGRVTDPQTLNLVGTYRRLSEYENGIAVRTERDRAYIFGGDVDSYTGVGTGTLYEYQQHTFQLNSTYAFPNIRGKAVSLLTAGPATLALVTRVHGDFTGTLYLLHEQATNEPTFEPPHFLARDVVNQNDSWTVLKFSLPVHDLMYSPQSRQLYASVTGVAGANGNSLVPINPFTAKASQSQYIGSEPNRLTRTKDGRYIWVGVDGASSVRRFDVLTGELNAMMPLGRSLEWGWFDSDDIAAVPNSSDAVVVARKNRYMTVPHESVAVYTADGLMPIYPPVRNGLESQLSTSDVIEYCDNSDLLHGGETQQSSFNFTRLRVIENGIKIVDKTRDVFDWYNFDILCQDELIVATNGQVIDPTTATEVATYPGIIRGLWPNAFAYNPQTKRMYVLSDDYHSTTAARFFVYDAVTFTLLDSYLVEGIPGEPRRLVMVDDNHLGLVMRDNTMYLLQRGASPILSHYQFVPQATSAVPTP